MQVYSIFYKHTYGKQDNVSFFVNKTKFKPQATAQKNEKIFLIGLPFLQYFKFQICGRHLIYSFSIYKKVQLSTCSK